MTASIHESAAVIIGPWENPAHEESGEIFYEAPEDPKPKSGNGAQSCEIFCTPSADFPKEGTDGIENQHRVETPKHLTDIQSLTKTQLKEKYKGEYSSWKNMKTRCKSGYELHPAFEKFADFLASVGPKPAPEYSIDRKDPSDLLYGPGLVRWATKRQQTENREVTTYLTDKDGTRLSLPEWSRRTGTSQSTMRTRRAEGWPDHEVIHGRQRSAVTPKTSNLPASIAKEWNGLVDNPYGAERMYRDLAQPDEMRVSFVLRRTYARVHHYRELSFRISMEEELECLAPIERLEAEARQREASAEYERWQQLLDRRVKIVYRRYGEALANEILESARHGQPVKYQPRKKHHYAPRYEDSDPYYNMGGENDGGEMEDTDSERWY